ncbi:hypothetical protein AB0H43_13370 [Hamadaea sp. NPDC050747]|uniref:hypothetical protein n=1 Tax=Hamadaea sp. NPDC050747 TaxID=3155789 RepID=UPI0033D8C60B
MHSATTAATTLALIAVLSLLLGPASISRIGAFSFPVPIAALLLLPMFGGWASAIACRNNVGIPLPDPPVVKAMRACWSSAWVLAAIAATSVGLATSADLTSAAVVRNVLIYHAIALATLSLGYPDLLWLPCIVYSISCMLFGYPPHEPRYYWWAIVMDSQASTGQLVAAGILAAAATALITVRRPAGPGAWAVRRARRAR